MQMIMSRSLSTCPNQNRGKVPTQIKEQGKGFAAISGAERFNYESLLSSETRAWQTTPPCEARGAATELIRSPPFKDVTPIDRYVL